MKSGVLAHEMNESLAKILSANGFSVEADVEFNNPGSNWQNIYELSKKYNLQLIGKLDHVTMNGSINTPSLQDWNRTIQTALNDYKDVVKIWEIWNEPTDSTFFIGNALEVAKLRDALHISRGGSFVDGSNCPDECEPICAHHGEPLNANNRRERISGPISRKPSGSSHASNFGGLVRMLKTSNNDMRNVFREIRAKNEIAHEYISFIHRNFPEEEFNQYTAEEWKKLSSSLSLPSNKGKKDTVITIRETITEYKEGLRNLYNS